MGLETFCARCGKSFVSKTTSKHKKHCIDCLLQSEKASRDKFKYKGICPICGGKCFTNAKICGLCRTKQGIESRICPSCGKQKTPQGKTCRKCDNAHKSQPRKIGGRKDKSGYILIYAPNHPRVKLAHRKNKKTKRLYVAEHILVWEKANGESLPIDWVIHHLNGFRDDNRIENLIAMPRKDHRSWTFIKAMQKRIRELEQLHMNL